MKTSKISEIKETIKRVYALSEKYRYLAVMLWGPAGVGKSASVAEVAKELGIEFIDLRLSILNPVDLRGLPALDKEHHKATWLEPDFLPNGKNGPKGILFLDEINLAPQSVMSAGYQLILDRKIGSYKMPDGWIIIAAGNRSEDGGAITRFPTPLANRFIHMEIAEPNFDEWREWAIQNGIHEHILAFLSKFPQHLYQPPKNQEKNFPTPRSWSFASDLHSMGLDISAAVGEGVASEFSVFLQVYSRIPDPEKILDGSLMAFPKENDVMWATIMALVYRVKKENVLTMFKWLDQKGFPKEFQVLGIVLSQKKDAEVFQTIANSSEWLEWSKRPENKDIFEN